jgi:hypothetical protein
MSDNVFVFISHISEEAALATSLKKWIEQTFPDQVTVFVSSDPGSIQAGDQWYDNIMEALRDTQIFVVVCSPAAVQRPWVNFEIGVAAFRDIRIIPVCHRGMSPSDLPQPLHRFQGVEISAPSMPKRLMATIAGMLGKVIKAMPEADMLASFHEASNATRESNITSDALAPASRAAVSAPRPSATNRARAIALLKRFDEETVRLLNNGNAAFHVAATMLIDELERRAERVISETGWEIQHGGDSHSEYVFYAEGYTFQLLPQQVYANTARDAFLRVRFFEGRLLSTVERKTRIVLEEPTELPGYQLKLIRSQALGWCWKLGDTELSNANAAEQIIHSFVLLIERKGASSRN